MLKFLGLCSDPQSETLKPTDILGLGYCSVLYCIVYGTVLYCT